MKYFLIGIISVGIVGCISPSLLPKKTRELMPKEANKVILTFDMTKDSLFNMAVELLVDENFRIYNYDKEIGFINTDGKNMRAGMIMRLNIKISESSDYSQLSGLSEWSLLSTNEDEEVWYQGKMSLGGYFNLCYESMILVLQKLPYKEIKYVKA